MTEWCLGEEIGLAEVTANAMGNVFVITGAINNGIASAVDHSIPISDTQAYFIKYQGIGKSFGQIV